MELRDRERKIDVSKMKNSDVDELSKQIGLKITEICDEAAAKINAILAIYGMKSVKIGIESEELAKKASPKPKAPAKRSKKIKQDNLK